MLGEFADTASNGDCGVKGDVLGHGPSLKYRFGKIKRCLLQTSDDARDHKAMLDSQDMKRRFVRALSANPGLRPKDVADACDVSPQAIGDWKRTGRIDKKHFPKLAELLHTSLDYWISDKPTNINEVTAAAASSAAGTAELLEDLAQVQTAIARVLAESISTVGAALVARLEKIDPRSERDYMTALKGILRRELASQDVEALQSSSHKARGSKPRKHR